MIFEILFAISTLQFDLKSKDVEDAFSYLFDGEQQQQDKQLMKHAHGIIGIPIDNHICHPTLELCKNLVEDETFADTKSMCQELTLDNFQDKEFEDEFETLTGLSNIYCWEQPDLDVLDENLQQQVKQDL